MSNAERLSPPPQVSAITTSPILPRITSSIDLLKDVQSRAPEVEIRDEQIAALDAIRANEAYGRDRTLIVMAPGLGKTTVMAADTRLRLLRNSDARVLFLCDKNDILSQARDRFERLIGPEYTYGLFNGDGRDYGELSVLFASFQVMREWREAFHKDEFQFGVVDEGHHGSAPTYEPTLRYFQPHHLLGVTATPDRRDIKDIRNIFGPERYTMTLEQAIGEGRLAAVDYYVLTDEIIESGELLDRHGRRYNISDLDRTIFAPKRDEEIVRLVHQYAEKLKNPKRIVFCRSITQADRYAELFPNAAAIHSSLSRMEQKQWLQSFREGTTTTLLAVDMFNEGVDIPDANQIVFLRSTESKTIFLQQLGRGLRKTPEKKRVQVLDFVSNCTRLLMVDRVWKDIAVHSKGEPEGDGDEIRLIDVGSVHFTESARRALTLLRTITKNVYPDDQSVPDGSVRLSSIAREAGFSLPGLLAVATSYRVDINHFPSHTTGREIPYVTGEDAVRLRLLAEKIRRRQNA